MSKSKSYIFKERDGELAFVGDFDGYYRDSDDPWEQSANAQMGRYYQLSRARLLTLAATSPNLGRILEVGCGHGHVTRLIAERFAGSEVCGLDISSVAIAGARQRYPQLPFFCANIGANPLPPELSGQRFGLVILNQLLWYILDDLPQVLANVRTLLASDGRLLISNAFAREQRYGTAIIDHFDGAVHYFRQAPGYRMLQARFDDDGEEHDDGHLLLAVAAPTEQPETSQ
ncbi:class I SAM-dependent methyltransferase [Niveibacterium sp. 24ML]|uniref:class I SAM-dependent methyltransferase n=1 Tax=Niveibacterium sp. 24ML TaxID=2985512 RepID=UPI0022703B6B|nr:class I SAM-dependent methyltransferase [Niveibacterium sp. 24ML]MCX9156181.1 class I SAM-dependent methyltransferase [Niveibacterium sp. 24ML]